MSALRDIPEILGFNCKGLKELYDSELPYILQTASSQIGPRLPITKIVLTCPWLRGVYFIKSILFRDAISNWIKFLKFRNKMTFSQTKPIW